MVKLMGCFFGKPSTADYSSETAKEKRPSKGLSEVCVNRVNSLKRNESLRSKGGDKRVGLLDRKLNGSKKVRDVTNFEIKEDGIDPVVNDPPVKRSGRRSAEWELIAAGWPSWLASVASEAINGWVPRRADTFEKIEKIGEGTYSSVYKARDLTNNKIVALKRVRFDNMDPESVKFMAREILILRKLDHPNVIKLEGLIAGSSSLYLVFEYMEHDLTGLASLPDSKFSEPQVKCYMKQLLSGLDHCHSHGVLHRDIKGSNLLIDNNGILKIADFGLATFFDQKQSQPLTSRVITLWYRPPELLLGATYYGVSVDLWSAGCILGELYARKPIMPGRTEVEQLHKIFKLCGSPSEEYWENSKLPHSTGFKPLQPYRRHLAETFKGFPSVSIRLMDTLLAIDPAHRGTAASALKNEFFMTNPLPCDPSCLPKYSPSKEIDVKLREEESRRQRTGGGRSQRANLESEGQNPSRALPEPNANAELVAAMKRRQDNLDSKSRNHYFSPNPHEAFSGLPTDEHRSSHRPKESNKDLTGHDPRRISHSGPLVPGVGWVRSEKRRDDILVPPAKANLSTSSRLVASRISENPQKSDNLFFGHSNVGRGRARSKEPVLGNRIKKNKNHFSGPLLVPNHNAEQMFKEHDRHIQEAARRARIDRARLFNNR